MDNHLQKLLEGIFQSKSLFLTMGKDIESLMKLFLQSKSTNSPSKIINILEKKDHRTYVLVCLYFAYISLAKQSHPFSEKKKQGGSRMIAMPSSRGRV